MYYISTIKSTLRVPPSRFSENLSDILLELARDSLEERIYDKIGFIVAVLEAGTVDEGHLIPGDAGAFYECDFKILSYIPESQVEDQVVERHGRLRIRSHTDAHSRTKEMERKFWADHI